MDYLILLACLITLGFCYFIMSQARKPKETYFIRVEMIQDVSGELTAGKVDWEIKMI